MKEINDALLIANALEDSGDLEGAIHVLSEAIERTPLEGSLHASRGRLLYLREAYAEAVADLDIAITLRPRATTLYTRARAKCLIGDLDGALADFERCVELQPGAADALCEMGLIHAYRKDDAAALASFEAAHVLVSGGLATSSSATAEELAETIAELRLRG